MKTRTPRFFSLCTLAVSFVLCWLPLYAQEDITFQKPPQEILQLVEAEPPPQVMIDPHGRYLAILKVSPFRNLAELAEPELRLAGIRINPRNHDASRSRYYLGIAIQEIQSGKKIAVTGLPENLRLEYPRFSSRSSYFSFVSVGPKGMELWVVELSSGRARKLTPPLVSAVMGFPYFWTPDDQAIYCRMRKTSQPPPDALELPTGPMVQEATGSRAPAPTFQDLLRSKGDEQRFDFYATHVLARFSLDGSSQMILPEGIYTQLVLSPNGEYLLVRQTHSPYSYQLPYYRFPYRVAIHDRSGKRVVEVCDKPLQDKIPISRDAVEDGKRGFAWRDDLPCTLAWVEAQDGGDPEKAASPRDILFQVGPPFTAKPQPLGGFEGRLYRVTWGDGKAAVAEDSWWKTRRVKTYLLNPAAPTSQPKVIFDYSREDLYHLPGDFATAPNPWTRQTLRFGKDRSTLYLMGEGYSPEGSRPFIDEYSLKTGKTRRLWRADGLRTYEEPVHLLDLAKKTILTRIESAKTPPNYYLRRLGSKSAPKPLTNFPNPYLSFEKVAKKKIHYKREDGVDLFGTLHLPPGYDPKKDGRLPMLMEAYPIEYKDKQAAGMVNDSPHQFVSMYWGSPVFWAVRGYAVLENAQFPIVGQGKEEPNDTYIEQLVANAKAAIKAVDEMGVVDPKRVAVMGHSYGAFMTANLLAHSDLFAAGIARSGAYNRSLTPFGFQAEDRLYWQAQSTYQRMSPFNYADKLKTPILLIHGDADNNSGTFTLQSERLFAALKGLGGKARLVLLPYESHGYASRENILHMLWEMDAWLERWVKPKK